MNITARLASTGFATADCNRDGESCVVGIGLCATDDSMRRVLLEVGDLKGKTQIALSYNSYRHLVTMMLGVFMEQCSERPEQALAEAAIIIARSKDAIAPTNQLLARAVQQARE